MARPSEDVGEGCAGSGLYRWLLRREEQAHRRPDLTLPWAAEQPSYTGTVDRLAALRTGRPINVPVSALPRWAQPAGEVHWWDRAIVEPGSVRFVEDDGCRWLQDSGL